MSTCIISSGGLFDVMVKGKGGLAYELMPRTSFDFSIVFALPFIATNSLTEGGKS
jgi:hypothetical protein